MVHEQATGMIQDFHGFSYRIDRHAEQINRLSAVLSEHPDAVLKSCSDENTGQRFGRAKCRAGRAVKIGGTTYVYQLWAVWP